jgi:hypothetical protein
MEKEAVVASLVVKLLLAFIKVAFLNTFNDNLKKLKAFFI